MALKIIALVFSLVFLISPFACAEGGLLKKNNKVFIIGGDHNFPPYEFVVEKNGMKSYRGFNVDIMKAISLQTGIEVEFRPMVWAEALKALEKGEIDAIEGIKHNDARTTLFAFSDAYIKSSQIIFVKRDTVVAEIDDLKGHLVAVQKGDVAHEKFKNEKMFTLVVTNTQEDAFDLLLSSQVTAVIGNKLVGQYLLNQSGQAQYVKMAGPDIDPYYYGIAVRKDNTELLNIVNSGLRKIKKNGTYDSIYKKWFGQIVDHPPEYYKDRLVVVMVIASLLLVGLFVAGSVGLALKKEVARRTLEIKKMNEHLNRKDKMEALGNLVAGIAHEIRTPITSLKTFAELLPDKYDNPVFRQKISRFVPQEVERIDLMVRSLLDYARPRKANPELFSLRQMVDNVLILFTGSMEKEKIFLEMSIDDKLFVFADQNQLKQVLINLLLNSIEAVKGREKRHIALTGLPGGAVVSLIIEDTGPGIGTDMENKIFDPFFTTKPDGTGLGLSITYNLVRENNGRIWQESVLGQGTKFFVELPTKN